MNQIKILKFINENSDYVFVDIDKIHSFLKKIDKFEYSHWLNNKNLLKTEKEKIIFSFICESMNFCFWESNDWYVIYENSKYKGSEALFYSLIKAVSERKLIIDVETLYKISIDDFKKIFRHDNKLPTMIDERYHLFKCTINVIQKKGEKFFLELFSIKNDEKLLEYIIKNFKHFNDKSKFKEHVIYFNKRAILLVNDLYNLSPIIKNNIKNINNLTGCADYSIPRLFVDCGIFHYNKELMKKITSKESIQHNSQMEIEIRANTLYVLELMKEILNKNNKKINCVELDNIIWKMRTNIKNNTPVHRTKCIYY